MEYFIQCAFGPDAEPQQYIGTREELLRNIRTTWSKVPHYVEAGSSTIRVIGMQVGSQSGLLATFELTPFSAMPLPGHF